MATIASFVTFAVAFFSRPVGAAVFGHFGDRLGRKKTLIATLLIMGLSTVGVGLVPSATSIGVFAPLLLLALRLLQGFAVGGEWAGAALLSAEYAPPAKRGMYGMFTQLGVGTGLVLSSLVFLTANLTIGEKSSTFMTWGWRLPFLFSAVLIIIALYVRLNIDETPVFKEVKRQNHVVRAPLGQVIRHQPKEIALCAGVMTGVFTFSFMGGTYLLGYASTQLHHPRPLILSVGVLGGLAMMLLTFTSARLCDKHGRAADHPDRICARRPVVFRGSTATRCRLTGAVRRGNSRNVCDPRHVLRLDGLLHSGDVRNALPLHQGRTLLQPRRHPRRGCPTVGCGRTTGFARSLGHRTDARSAGWHQFDQHLRPAGNYGESL